ncbi:MAG: hypothetical protein Kow0068_19430 [Marinilabiliales bacterium]
MKTVYKIIFALIFIVILQSCYWGKYIEENQKVAINTDFDVEMIDESGQAKYLNNYLKEDYRSAFLDKLKEQLSLKNITVLPENSNQADFELLIKNMKITERLITETVDDTASEQYGETYYLADCLINIEASLYKGPASGNHELKNFKIFAGKDERVTNNRTFFDYIFGLNKDYSVYHFKDLPEDIFIDLSEKCAQKVHDKVTRKIAKKIKK